MIPNHPHSPRWGIDSKMFAVILLILMHVVHSVAFLEKVCRCAFMFTVSKG